MDPPRPVVTGGHTAPHWPPALRGLCRVCVSVPNRGAGGRGGVLAPQILLCAVPKCRVVSSSLMFMPLYKRQRICRMVFPVCSFYTAQLRLSASARGGAAPLPADPGGGRGGPAAGSLSAAATRMYVCASVFYRGDPVPRAGGGSLRCRGPLQVPISSSAPDGCRESSRLRVRPLGPLRHRCGEGGGGEGGSAARGGQEAAEAGRGPSSPLARPIRVPEPLVPWRCYFSTTE